MTLGEYYEKLKERYEQTDFDKFEEVKAYNEYRRNLRKELEEEMAK